MCIMLSNLDSFLPGFSYLIRIDEVEKKRKERDMETGTGVISGVGRVYIKAFRSQFYHFLASSTLLNTCGEDVAPLFVTVAGVCSTCTPSTMKSRISRRRLVHPELTLLFYL